MSILGIPDIVILEPVHAHLKPAIGIKVHIGDEVCGKSSIPPSIEYSLD